MPTNEQPEVTTEDPEDFELRLASDKDFDPSQPPLGSWASVARMMASEFPDDGIDWDRWKDEMKETDGAGY